MEEEPQTASRSGDGHAGGGGGRGAKGGGRGGKGRHGGGGRSGGGDRDRDRNEDGGRASCGDQDDGQGQNWDRRGGGGWQDRRGGGYGGGGGNRGGGGGGGGAGGHSRGRGGRGHGNHGSGGYSRGGGDGGGHGGGNVDPPVPLGKPIAARLPGLDKNTESKRCLLCYTDSPSYVAVGRCGHADACWVCTLRLRALAGDRHCPVCKEDLSEVFVTSDASAAFPSATELAQLPFDEALGVRFEDELAQEEALRLFEYRCRLQQCCSDGTAFTHLHELERHLWYVHWRQFCQTCLHHRPAFMCEQMVYDSRDMTRHFREGDASLGSGTTPVPPHPLCEFCNERLFDDDELHLHMHEKHHMCHVCAHAGRPCEFFMNLKCVSAHYAEDHHVCAHPDCTHGGVRLAAFATEDELSLHMIKQHTDRSQMTDKEKKALSRPLLIVGHRSYHDERAANSGAAFGTAKGGGKGDRRAAVNDVAEIRFAWPRGMSQEEARRGQTEKGDDEDEGAQRYPERPIFTERSELQEQQEEDNDREGECEDESGHDGEPRLDERLNELTLDVTVACSGHQMGMRCCLDALRAVLRALCRGSVDNVVVDTEGIHTLRAAVGSLGLGDLDTLDRLRKDLTSNEAETKCDWEPLEGILSLRPLFFRLLRSSRHGNASGGIGPKIGGGRIGASETPDTAWRTWLLAAQGAVMALGPLERQRLRNYVEMSHRRRAELSANAGICGSDLAPGASVVSVAAQEGDPEGPPLGGTSHVAPIDRTDVAEFPTLGGGDSVPIPEAQLGPGSGWGKQRGQGPPPIIRSGARGIESQLMGVDDFPGLCGSSLSATSESASWGGQARQRGAAPPTTLPRTSEKKQSLSVTGDMFPGLSSGGSSKSMEPNKTWAAQVRERAAAPVQPTQPESWVPVAAAPPKEFTGIQEEAFPDLPMGSPQKPKTAMGKAGARSGAAAKSKAAAKATAQQEQADTPATSGRAFEAPKEEELIMIHNPLDAVALSEKANTERQSKKSGKKQQGSSRRFVDKPNCWSQNAA